MLEIIIVTRDCPKPKKVRFEDLYGLKERIETIMFLWDTNCYYVDCKNNAFIINGGRRLAFPNLGNTCIEFRRRNTMQVSSGVKAISRTCTWIIGIKSIDSGSMCLLEIEHSGNSWKWKTGL